MRLGLLLMGCVSCLTIGGCKPVSRLNGGVYTSTWEARDFEELSLDAPFSFSKDESSTKQIQQLPPFEPTTAAYSGHDSKMAIHVALFDLKRDTVFSPNMAVEAITKKTAQDFDSPVPVATLKNWPVSGFETRYASCIFEAKKNEAGRVHAKIAILHRDRNIWAVMILYRNDEQALDAQHVIETIKMSLPG